MWALALQLIFIALYPQVSTCYQSCTLNRLKADCKMQHHLWVPALPPNITHLYLEHNDIREINSTSLRAYDQLLELDLGKQSVRLIIKKYAFLRQRKLTRLVLGFNRFLQLDLRAFSGLFNLKHLFLDYCDLNESILADNYLQPLLSLESLDLFGNQIRSLRPGLFFSRLTKFTFLNLTLNQIETLCEEDLAGFQGKYFASLNLKSNSLGYRKDGGDFGWKGCGNPFRGMAFNVLDLSLNSFNISTARQFFKVIEGTPIGHLRFYGHIGKGFSHKNLPDPEESTFEGLTNVENLDLSGNFIFALKRAVFRSLKKAIIINVSKNKVNQIMNNAFDGLEGHLRMLDLSSNLLGEVFSHTFANLTDLRVLNLSYNHIGILGNEAFSGLPKLRALYLTGNSLRNLGLPASLPNLDYLLLGDNRLNSLYNIATLGMNSTHVDVSDNRLTNMEDVYFISSNFSRLKNLFFGGNFIKWCTVSPNIKIPQNNSVHVLDLHDSSLHVLWMQGQCLNLFDDLQNLLGLNLSYNSLATLPPRIFSKLSSLYELDLSSNALTYLQPDAFPLSLKRLYLADNFLASPDPAAFRSLLFLSLAGNRFHCDCHLEGFLHWLNTTNVTISLEDPRCEFPADLQNLPLLTFTTLIEPCKEDDEKSVQELKLALFILSALLCLTLVLGGVIYARLRGQIFIVYKKIIGRVVEGPKVAAPEDEVLYDAFLCFSNNDYRWVEAALLQKLDHQFSEENVFRCCFEARDFLPGEDHVSNIRDAIWSSRKTVCIVSREFLKDGWCLEAFSLAQGRMLEELTNALIMLVVGKVAHYQLMKCKAIRAFVQRRNYLTWPEDPQDLDLFYERLASKILKDSKVKKVIGENPECAEPDVQVQPGNNMEMDNIGRNLT